MTHMGEMVRNIRESMNWTVTRLEKRSGVSRNAIYRIESTGYGRIDSFQAVLGAMGYEIEVVKKDGWDFCE